MSKSYFRICPKCRSQDIKKDGKRKGRQSYKCKLCNHIWVTKSRLKLHQEKIKQQMYIDYSHHKQTYYELHNRYNLSIKTVQRYLDSQGSIIGLLNKPTSIILLIDTTYFGNVGLMVFKETHSKRILHYEIVKYETNEAYRRGIRKIQDAGWNIKAIVCDGRRGLLGGFESIPTQMCHFHQKQIIRRYITKKPILEANKELKLLVDRLPRTDKKSFSSGLIKRYEKHKEFVNERTINEKKKRYKHNRTRSAYLSLKRNLQYLFVYEDYLGRLDIPNTTNGLEGLFSQLKYKINLHRGLRPDRKLKLILFLLLSRLY